jgi:malate dehydrogenase (oxaloacetate-decarboxylating)
MMNLREEALAMHRQGPGKITVQSTVKVDDKHQLSLAYTPGVAEPCREIQENPELSWEYTARGNMVAVVTDGSSVLGLGNIGPLAAMPVMEGKAVLFREFAGVDAFPICLSTQDPEEIIAAVQAIAPSFGGINLEDISAPRCFEIERRLDAALEIPVFHDDQHGTAVVTLAGILNSMRIVDKDLATAKIVINGSGAAGTAIAKLLLDAGAKRIIVCDRKGAIRQDSKNPAKAELAQLTNPQGEMGTLHDLLRGADVFIGVSKANQLGTDQVKTMACEPVIFALANPEPEIWPEEAALGGARIIATGRSDFPNQVNNVLGFPGIFKGALCVRATTINHQMKMAAARAIASLVSDKELARGTVIPDPFLKDVPKVVAQKVAQAALASGVARATGEVACGCM